MISVGIRYGAALSVLVVVLGTLGNMAAFKWLPEVPLLVITAATPIAVCAAAGWRAVRMLKSIRLGTVAGGMAGFMGGLTGGIFFVVIGKPVVDLPVLSVLGIAGGLVAGFVGSVAAHRWTTA
jgi:hypothetical protein